VTATDANSCTVAQSFTITAPTAVSVTASAQTNVSCNGGSNGAASVNAATGGTGTITYNWTPNNPSGDGTTSVTGLTAGTWTVTATDANSCAASQSFTITEPAAAVVVTAASQTNITCGGATNGAASINAATGGTPGYTYDWTPGTPTGDGTTSVTGLAAGTYTVTATDFNGCMASQSFTITQGAGLSMTAASQTNIACNGNATGAASVNPPTGASGTVTYDWTPGTPTGDGTTSVTGLMAGTYTATATDGNGCTATATFTITQPAAITTPTTQTNVSCNGGSNGSATVIPAGGAGTYTYSWAPVGGNAATASGLPQGTYTVTVTDGNSCTATQAVTITEPAALLATISSQTNVSCNGGSNGSVSVSLAGGTPGFTYSWAPAGGNGATASGLEAGTYTVTVTDANTCMTTATATLTEPSLLVATATADSPVSCFGLADGEASASVTGGTGTYTYSWAPSGGTAATATGLTAGTYTVTVTDQYGCEVDEVVTITEPTQISINGTQTSPSCFGVADGEITATVTGGTGDYEYSWSPAGGTAATASNLADGGYTVTVTDEAGCTASNTWYITQPSAIIITSTQTDNTTCSYDSTGTATVTATSGVGAYDYSWAPYGGTAADAEELAAGTYTVTVTDDNGCEAEHEIIITAPAAIVLTPSQTNISCNGEEDGTATIAATGGTGTEYEYSWSPTGETTTTISDLEAGTYTVTVTDENGCEAEQSVTITQAAAITFTDNVSICAGQTHTVGQNTYATSGTYTDILEAQNGCDSTVTTILVVGGAVNVATTVSGITITATAAGAQYQWINCATNAPIAGATSQSFTPAANGSYAVIVTQGCADTSVCTSITTVGLEELSTNWNATLYPNPSNGSVTINWGKAMANVNIDITDVAGKVIYSKTVQQAASHTIALDQPTGVYYVRLSTENEAVVLKMVKN